MGPHRWCLMSYKSTAMQCEDCAKLGTVDFPNFLMDLNGIVEVKNCSCAGPDSCRVDVSSLLENPSLAENAWKTVENHIRYFERTARQLGERLSQIADTLVKLEEEVPVIQQTSEDSTKGLLCDICVSPLSKETFVPLDTRRCNRCLINYSIEFKFDDVFTSEFFGLKGWRNVPDGRGSWEARLAIDCIPFELLDQMKRYARERLEVAGTQQDVSRLNVCKLTQLMHAFEKFGL